MADYLSRPQEPTWEERLCRAVVQRIYRASVPDVGPAEAALAVIPAKN